MLTDDQRKELSKAVATVRSLTRKGFSVRTDVGTGYISIECGKEYKEACRVVRQYSGRRGKITGGHLSAYTIGLDMDLGLDVCDELLRYQEEENA